MKLKLIIVLCFAVLLGGCSLLDEPAAELVVSANKLAAHPPATITIRADLAPGWSFSFDTDERTFRTGTTEVSITFYELPAVVTVTAYKAGEIDQHGEIFIDLINEPVNMSERPAVTTYGYTQGGMLPNALNNHLGPFDGVIGPQDLVRYEHYLSPLSYHVFLCKRYEGKEMPEGSSITDSSGFYDPDGDEWHIVEVVAWYEAGGESNPDAVFASVPYKGEGFYQVKRNENSFLIIPSWPQIISPSTGTLTAPPGGVPGYPSVCHNYSCSVANHPTQDYYVKITTEDVYGARNTKTFVYRLLPTGCY